MSCSSCGNNSLTSCTCTDNCPNQTSELTFDGVLNNIPVPDGSNLNDVLALLEGYIITTISELDLSYEVLPGNCLGLTPGIFGYDQMFDALTAALCALNIDVNALESSFDAFVIETNNSISTIEGDIVTLQSEVSNINLALGEAMPVGSMMMYPTATAPNAKWSICEGQTLATALYPDLFLAIGYSFGGAGAFFSLPDLRGKFFAGYDATASSEYQTIGQGGGQDSVTLTKEQSGLPTHTHTATTTGTIGGSFADLTTATGDGATPADDDRIRIAADGNLTLDDHRQQSEHTHSFSGSTTVNNFVGVDAINAHENRPSFVVFPWMIKVLN